MMTREAADPDAKRKFVIQQTWRLVESGPGSKLTATFYQRLFDKHPDVKPMFSKADMTFQTAKVYEVIQVAVRFLDDMAQVQPLLEDIGVRHARDYGVLKGHYDAMTLCFVEALDVVLQSEKTSLPTGITTGDVRESFKWVLDLVGKIMSDGADRALTKPTMTE